MSTQTDSKVLLDKDIASSIQAVAKAVAKAVVDGRRCCIHCVHFDEASEMCALAQQRPPARVIALGCDAFIEDDIPF